MIVKESISSVFEPKTDNDVLNFLRDKKFVSYDNFRNIWTNKGKEREINNTQVLYSYLRPYDYVVFIEKSITPSGIMVSDYLGIVDAKFLAGALFTNGHIYHNIDKMKKYHQKEFDDIDPTLFREFLKEKNLL